MPKHLANTTYSSFYEPFTEEIGDTFTYPTPWCPQHTRPELYQSQLMPSLTIVPPCNGTLYRSTLQGLYSILNRTPFSLSSLDWDPRSRLLNCSLEPMERHMQFFEDLPLSYHSTLDSFLACLKANGCNSVGSQAWPVWRIAHTSSVTRRSALKYA